MELRVHAAALSPRPHGPGAADVRLHLRVLRPGADGLGPRGAAAAGAGDPAGHHADRARRVLGLPAVPDRASALRSRCCSGCFSSAAASAPWCAPASTTPPWRRASAAISRLLFTGIFGAGVALAALGGVAAGPVLGLYPGMDTEILIPAFIVIVIGGMGSLRGAFVGSLLIGDRRYLRQGLFPEPRAVPDLSGDGGGAAGAAAGPVRHQVFRRLGRARGHHREHAGHDADARGRAARDPGDAGLPVPGGGLSARAARRDLHLRDLRHEPRPAARLHRPDVARPRRLLRAGRLRRGDPRDAVRRQRLARRSRPASPSPRPAPR